MTTLVYCTIVEGAKPAHVPTVPDRAFRIGPGEQTPRPLRGIVQPPQPSPARVAASRSGGARGLLHARPFPVSRAPNCQSVLLEPRTAGVPRPSPDGNILNKFRPVRRPVRLFPSKHELRPRRFPTMPLSPGRGANSPCIYTRTALRFCIFPKTNTK